jgi:hypothetical protein
MAKGKYGTSKKENHVHTKAMAEALVAECQNLNSGNLHVSRRKNWVLPADERTEFVVLFGGKTA